MSDERIRSKPAAWALLAYSAGLWSASILIVPAAALAASMAIAGLLLGLCRPWRFLAALALGFVALGLWTGLRDARAARAERALLERIGRERFVSVRVPVEDDWVRRPDGQFVLRARSFEVLESGAVRRFARELIVSSRAVPPDVINARAIVVEGFLRELPRGGYRLSVKSSRLVTREGRPCRLDPKWWNRKIARQLEEAASGWESARRGASLVEALVLGRHGSLPDNVLESYQRGGTYHLLVFSGMQIALFAAALRWLVALAGLRRAGDFLLLAICALAPSFVGSDPSVSRSAWMLGAFLFTRLWKRPADPGNLVFVSALVRLVLVPGDLADPGFALTYAATGGLLLIGKPMAASWKRAPAIAYGLGAELSTLPLTLFFFNRVVVGGWVATILIAPVLLAMLAAGASACVLALISTDAAFVALDLVDAMNGAAMAVNGAVADHLRLSIVGPAPPPGILILCLTAAFAVASRGVPRAWKAPAFLLVTPLLASAVLAWTLASTPDFQMSMIDVGQGDSILLRNGRQAMLVDAGGRGADEGFGRRVLLPRLLERGVRRLDVVALSHPHPDHCGGMRAVIRELDVGIVLVSRRHVGAPCVQEILEAARERATPVADVESQPDFALGVMRLRAIATRFRFKRAQENNSSVVYRLESNGRAILLTGDVEKEAELLLRFDDPGLLRADVLKVPHHGSDSSSTAPFLDLVRPRIALVSCGRENLFGHPAEGVLERLAARNTRTLRTDRNGTVTLTVRNGRVYVESEFDTPRGPP